MTAETATSDSELEHTSSRKQSASSRTTAPTIAVEFRTRKNSLNAIRLVLAGLVIVSHAWPLRGEASEPSAGGLSLGSWAVLGFFAISGFLITRSRLSPRSSLTFWKARAFRILPGLWVALIVVAFAFAPLASALAGNAEWSPISSIFYVARNAAVYPFGLYQASIDGAFTNLPYPDADGPLYTLFWEACCYVAVGLIVPLASRKGLLTAFSITAIALGSVASAVAHFTYVPDIAVRAISMLTAFAAGTLIASVAHRLPVSKRLVLIACGVLLTTFATGLGAAVACLPLAYLILCTSTRIPFHKVGSRFDVSYGFYIYAWPVQQMLLVLFGTIIPVGWMILLVVLSTAPFAFLSCVLIERPALRLVRGQPSTMARKQRPATQPRMQAQQE